MEIPTVLFSGKKRTILQWRNAKHDEKVFNNSVSQFASYFTANAKLSEKQLKELRDMIDLEIEKNKKMDSSKIILLLGISFLCWLIYKLVLADHKLFVFNRFFLLGAVVISLIVPFIQIDIARENNPGYSNCKHLLYSGSYYW